MGLNITGIFETSITSGTINTSATTGATITLGGPSNIWVRPYLQMFDNDDGFVSLSIGSFTDDKGTHQGPFIPGIFANKVTKFFVRNDSTDCVARAIVTVFFFG
jgi:hypothetical protein